MQESESHTRQATRRQIIDSAKRLFQERGVIDMSMQDIADAGGITRTTLYDYFSTKNELLSAIVYEWIVELYDFGLPTPRYMNGFEKIRLFCHTLFDRLLEKRHIMRFLLAYYQLNRVVDPQEEQTHGRIADEQKGYFVFELLKEGIKDGSVSSEDTETKFRVVLEHLLALGYRYALRDGSFVGWETPLDQAILRRSIDALLEILRPDSAAGRQT